MKYVAPIHYRNCVNLFMLTVKDVHFTLLNIKKQFLNKKIFLTQKKLYTNLYVNIHMALSSVYMYEFKFSPRLLQYLHGRSPGFCSNLFRLFYMQQPR